MCAIPNIGGGFIHVALSKSPCLKHFGGKLRLNESAPADLNGADLRWLAMGGQWTRFQPDQTP